jgi:DNA-binding response OmpR family regulator
MMVTGRDDVASINQSYQAGATDFLAKPINWNLLGHRVQYLVRGGRLVQDSKRAKPATRRCSTPCPTLLPGRRHAGPHRRPARCHRQSSLPAMGRHREQKIADLVSGEAARAMRHALDDCRRAQ